MDKFNWDEFEDDKSSEQTKSVKAFDWNEFEDDKEETSKLESLARGAAQGATFNFADEIVGGVESLGAIPEAVKSLSTDPIKDAYNQAVSESRENFNKAEQDNPLTFGSGEFVGGATSAVIPGVNVAKGLGLGGKILSNVGMGALQGGASSLGESEDINTESIGEAVDSSIVGGGLGGSLPLLGKGVNFAKDFISNKPLVKEAMESATLSKIGRSPIEKGIDDRLIKETTEEFSGITDKLNEARRLSAEERNIILESSGKGAGQKLNDAKKFIEGEISDTIDPTELQKLKDIENRLSKIDTGAGVTANEYQKLIDSIKKRSNNSDISGYAAKNVMGILKEGRDEVLDSEGLKDLYAKSTAKYGATKDIGKELGAFNQNVFDSDYDKNLKKFMDYVESSSGEKLSKKQSLDNLKELLSKTGAYNNEDATKLVSNIKDMGNQKQLADVYRSSGLLSTGFGTKNAAIALGAKAGELSNIIPESVKKTFDKGSTVIGRGLDTGLKRSGTTSPEQTQTEVQQLANDEAFGQFKPQLDKALNASSDERNSILYGLKTQPAFRKLLERTKSKVGGQSE